MKTIITRMTTVVAAAACGLLNGCLSCNCTKEAVYEPIDPTQWSSGAQTGMFPANVRLSYQWYITNANPSPATFSVEATGGTNGALFYQWYKNTNQ